MDRESFPVHLNNTALEGNFADRDSIEEHHLEPRFLGCALNRIHGQDEP